MLFTLLSLFDGRGGQTHSSVDVVDVVVISSLCLGKQRWPSTYTGTSVQFVNSISRIPIAPDLYLSDSLLPIVVGRGEICAYVIEVKCSPPRIQHAEIRGWG